MDDRHAQCVTAVGDLCATAALASLEVELHTSDGSHLHDVPGSLRAADDQEQVDDHAVNLDDIVACTLHHPSGG